jgi:hypothetical protein
VHSVYHTENTLGVKVGRHLERLLIELVSKITKQLE